MPFSSKIEAYCFVFLHKKLVDALYLTIDTSFSNFTAFLPPNLNFKKYFTFQTLKKQPAPSSRVASLQKVLLVVTNEEANQRRRVVPGCGAADGVANGAGMLKAADKSQHTI